MKRLGVVLGLLAALAVLTVGPMLAVGGCFHGPLFGGGATYTYTGTTDPLSPPFDMTPSPNTQPLFTGKRLDAGPDGHPLADPADAGVD